MDLTPVEQRVLGCLLEKQRTTPDQYPLTLNALRLACNQATNRDPVVDYADEDLRPALEKLSRRRWVRYASGHGSRAPKYRHLLDETLDLGPEELALLTVLLLRGPQTPGELKGRTERLRAFAALDEVHTVLDGLAEREFVRSIGRRPGQKEERWQHMLGDDAEPLDTANLDPYQEETPPPSPAALAAAGGDRLDRAGLSGGRLAALEAEVRALRDELDALRERLDQLTG